MRPVFDERKKYAGEPGLHVLIVGVSRYRYLPVGELRTDRQRRYGLGLSQLSCAARTGRLFYDWLLEARPGLPVPLVTCRLLLAPVAGEIDGFNQPQLGVRGATLKSVLKAAAGWREDAASRQGNVTLFYFAGHGFQRDRGDHVLTLSDLGDGIGASLKNAIDTFSLIGGMAPSEDYPDIARQQLYFFDACRLPSTEAYKYEKQPCTPVWDVPTLSEEIADDREAPVYHTTEPGKRAFAIDGEQTIFSKALLRSLGGDGAEELNRDSWCVTVASLNKGLEHHMKALEKEYGRRQRFKANGVSGTVVLYRLGRPPRVAIDVEVAPEHLAQKVELKVNDLQLPEETYGPPLDPHPYPLCLKAGEYLVTTRVVEPPGHDPVSRIERVKLPPEGWRLDV